MAIKQLAIPLDEQSSKQGEATFKKLANAGADADFELTNVTASPASNELNLITKKGGVTKDHKFTLAFSGSSAKVTLSAASLSSIFGDADGGDWDYVEAKWTVGQINTPNTSSMYIHQSGRTYNLYDW